MAGDQRAGRGHADEHRPLPVADAGAGLLAERGVGLVADHDRVGVGDLAGVADEPLVGLDGDRPVGVVLALQQRRREPVGVAAVGDLADELVDEVAAVGEDQDAAGPRGLDEADRGDGLAGAGRVLEPEAATGVGIIGDFGDEVVVLLLVGLVPVLWLLVLGERVVLVAAGAVAGGVGALAVRPVAVAVRPRLLDLGDDGGEGAGERVDLVFGELGAVAEQRPLLGEDPLEAEQQRVILAPLRRRLLEALVEFDEGGVEGEPPGGAGQQLLERLAIEQDRLTRELLYAFEIGARWRVGRVGGKCGGFCHEKGLVPARFGPRRSELRSKLVEARRSGCCAGRGPAVQLSPRTA